MDSIQIRNEHNKRICDLTFDKNGKPDSFDFRNIKHESIGYKCLIEQINKGIK